MPPLRVASRPARSFRGSPSRLTTPDRSNGAPVADLGRRWPSVADVPVPLNLETVRDAPKVLLHDHLDGGLRPTTVLELADAIGYQDLPTPEADELGSWFVTASHSGSLERYLETFGHTVAVMQNEQALVRVAAECAEDLAMDGVVYAEVRFAPRAARGAGAGAGSGGRGRPGGLPGRQPTAAERGRRIRVGCLLTAMRHAARSREIAELAVRYRDLGVLGFDIDTIIAPGTFAALGIPLKSGRDFSDGDTNDQPLVAIVNEALVRRSLAGQDPIGRTIFCPFDRPDGMTIVGVVGDVRQRNPAIEPMPECYMPYTQHSYNSNTLNVVVRTAGDPLALAGTLRRVAAEISPEVPVSFTTMEAAVSEGVEDPRFRTLLFGLFAALAVCLAMAGVYGVMAYAVEQRSREIGVRMALGADKTTVVRLILRQGIVLALAGLALGLAGAVAATRLLETVLFEVRPIDVAGVSGGRRPDRVSSRCSPVIFQPGARPVLNPVDALKAE